MKAVVPGVNHVAFRDDLLGLLAKHGAHLSAMEILALTSYCVGQMVAAQDSATVTPEMAIEVVTKNMQMGNQHAIESMRGKMI